MYIQKLKTSDYKTTTTRLCDSVYVDAKKIQLSNKIMQVFILFSLPAMDAEEVQWYHMYICIRLLLL